MARGEAGFKIWLHRLDLLFAKDFGGLGHDDFEDWDWWNCYNSGETVQDSYNEWYQENIVE